MHLWNVLEHEMLQHGKAACSVSICSEFEAIKERALKVPETSEEMMDLISYIEKARTAGIEDLALRIQVRNFWWTYFKSFFFYCGMCNMCETHG